MEKTNDLSCDLREAGGARRGSTVVLVPVESDSMAPLLWPGDAVLMKETPCTKNSELYDGLYVLDMGNGPTSVKRLQFGIKPGVKVKSENKDYKPWGITVRELLEDHRPHAVTHIIKRVG